MLSFVGTRTASDINLILQLVILVGLFYGFVLARRQCFARHANLQTAMVLLNLPLIAFVMVPSFNDFIIAGGNTAGFGARLMIAHGLIGLVVELVALYLILQMRTPLVPCRLRIGNIKLAMRATLALWTAVVLMGLTIYVIGYVLPRAPVGAGG